MSPSPRPEYLRLVTDDFASSASYAPPIPLEHLTFMTEAAFIAHEAVERLLLAINEGDLDRANYLAKRAKSETKALCKLTRAAMEQAAAGQRPGVGELNLD